ncbi:hypothetical protein CCHR01_05320 [Colletotrichum chrysophilum]|uniref:Uncharacterized protein n=1 Tax=Colletotrichum chrysophilum TaxID=1836956 RepID=A0AAD9ARA4_9PEZI|nr:hypothetical protein CCHR01_05320 [Colletotrichum chrysophilum]
MLHCIVNHGRYPTTGRPKLPIGPARSALCRQLYGSSDIMIHHGSIVDSLTRREHAPGDPCPPPRPHPQSHRYEAAGRSPVDCRLQAREPSAHPSPKTMATTGSAPGTRRTRRRNSQRQLAEHLTDHTHHTFD